MHRHRVFDARHVAQPHRLAHAELEPGKVLEGGADTRSPPLHVERGQVHTVHENAPLVRPIEAAQQLDQRRLAGAVLPHQRYHRPGGQEQ